MQFSLRDQRGRIRDRNQYTSYYFWISNGLSSENDTTHLLYITVVKSAQMYITPHWYSSLLPEHVKPSLVKPMLTCTAKENTLVLKASICDPARITWSVLLQVGWCGKRKQRLMLVTSMQSDCAFWLECNLFLWSPDIKFLLVFRIKCGGLLIIGQLNSTKTFQQYNNIDNRAIAGNFPPWNALPSTSCSCSSKNVHWISAWRLGDWELHSYSVVQSKHQSYNLVFCPLLLLLWLIKFDIANLTLQIGPSNNK